MKYDIITASSPALLAFDVSKKLAEGWHLHGNLQTTDTLEYGQKKWSYHQAVVKPDDKE